MTEDTDGVVGTIAPNEAAAVASPYHPEDEAIVAADGQLEQFPEMAMGAADDDAEDEPEVAGEPLKGLDFTTHEEKYSVHNAMDERIVSLKKLSKKLADAGKHRAAQDCDREVAIINESILPQLGRQRVMVFNENETLPQAVARVFSGEFRSRVRGKLTSFTQVDGGETFEDAKQRRLELLDNMEDLIGNIGDVAGAMVVKMVTAAAERGYEKGLIVNGANASSIAREALQAVSAIPSE